MSARARPLIALCVVAAALAAAGTIAIPAAHTAQQQRDKPPTLLWKSYPLEQRPRPRAVKPSVVRTKDASAQTVPRSGRQLENLLLASVLVATLLAIATIVLLRSSVPVRVGSSLRGRVRAPSPRPVRRPKPRETPPERKERPPLREVTADFVEEPETPPAEVAERQPEPDLVDVLQPKPQTRPRRRKRARKPLVLEERGGVRHAGAAAEARQAEPEQMPEPVVFERHVERTAGAAAEARQPEPEPEPTSEPVLELQLRELIEQKHAAPSAARPELEREIEALHERIETRPAEAPQPDAGPVSLARCEIRLWRGFIRCQLYATLGGSEVAFALSPYFRLRDDLAPNEQAQQALAALVAELEQGGWTVVSEGRPWYRHTLELFPPEPD